MSDLTGSVGRGGENRPGDTKMVQHLLNDVHGRAGLPRLAVSGVADHATVLAIVNFQVARGIVDELGFATGLVEPGSLTITRLKQEVLANIRQGVIPLNIPNLTRPDRTLVAEVEEQLWEALKLP